FKTRIWTVPPERMKGGREHRIPLSDRALKIVEARIAARGPGFKVEKHPEAFVFPGRDPGSRWAKPCSRTCSVAWSGIRTRPHTVFEAVFEPGPRNARITRATC